MKNTYWPDEYIGKIKTADEAVRMIGSGQRVFIGSACGEPQHLVKALVDNANHFSDLEIMRLMSLESSPISLTALKGKYNHINMRCIYQGSSATKNMSRNKRFMMPMNLSDVPNLFRKRRLPVQAALIQVSPPDDFGWMSLGISVDVTLAAAKSADLVIAQVNPKMPRTLGRSIIHVNEVDVIVEKEEDILEIESPSELGPSYSSVIPQIARLAANLIDDGSTIQFDLGITSRGLVMSLSEKNDLGIHTQFLTEGVMDLVSMGVITNVYKGLNEGKLVTSNALGSHNLYEFVNDNPSIEFHPSDYVNNPAIIARHERMVSINVALSMDLIGQVSSDALPQNHYSGVTGMPEFVRGSVLSNGGKSIMMIASTSADGKKSRIVPELPSGSVIIPKADVHFVISEFGAVNLFGKTIQERTMAMISLAHPDFREELLQNAKDRGLMDKDRDLKEFLFGVYPSKMEETILYDGKRVTFRPAKPVDDRRIQEHFYTLGKKDVSSRFMFAKKSFFRDEMADMFQIDYVKNLTVLAITGEFGFGKVIGIGEYSLLNNGNTAEVAFSVSGEWQGRGIARVLMKKLAQAAKDNGIPGLVAFTSAGNRAMVKLFKTLPYKVETEFDGDLYTLSCTFDEPLSEDAGEKK